MRKPAAAAIALAAAVLAGQAHARTGWAPRQPAQIPCAAPRLNSVVVARLRQPIRWTAGVERLDRALEEIARRSGVPISIVLAAPLPSVRVPSGELTASALLSRFVGATAGYAWQNRRGVVWFSYIANEHRRQNFLNWQVREITLRGAVGDLLPVLRELAVSGNGAAHTLIGVGVGAPAGPCVLPLRTLKGQTVRAVLQRVMQTAPQFYSAIIFPRTPRLTRAEALKAMSRWQWVWLAQPPPKPIPGISASNGG